MGQLEDIERLRKKRNRRLRNCKARPIAARPRRMIH